MMIGKKKDPTRIHIDFSNRPIVAICGCGEILRGKRSALPADKIYLIDGYMLCRRCALRWFDEEYCMTDYL